ncbi:ATP-binding cassette domain-containing protein [Candidatus Saccharibacteria bacterium]|nr:ATP-binding cassette domain-containing protein [Candidatus Saccharibacteria bacterium]
MAQEVNNQQPSPNNLIELHDINRVFGIGEAESYALQNFYLQVKPGEFIMIMGPSGCGKTTLLNILSFLDHPTSGQYFLNQTPTSHFSSRRLAKLRSQKIGIIFQEYNLIPTLTVLENVALPLIYAGVSHTKAIIKASETLKNFDLQTKEYYYPYQLSGGQKQRVAIARALVANPEIILADEPTGSLDTKSSEAVMQELHRVHQAGNTIIMVTHNPALTKYATRVLHMIDGSIDRDFKFVADHNLPERIDIHFNPKTAKSETTPVSSCSEEIPVTNKSEIPRIIKSETPRITSESKPTSMRPKITRAPEPSANPFEPKFIPNTPEKPTEKSVEKPLSYNLGTVSELPTSSKKPVSTPVKEYFPPVKSKTEETKPETPKKEAEEVEPVSQIATITPIKRNKSNSALKFNLNFNKKSKSHTKKSTKKKGHK